jgi:hypothetical protein
MTEYAKQRSLKLLDHVCTMSFPFESLIVQRIIELKHGADEQDFWQKTPSLLIQALIEMETYIPKAIEELGEIEDCIRKICEHQKNKEFIDRFRAYKNLKKSLNSDSEIFKIMFAQSSGKGETLRAFSARMRKWKHDHKELFEGEWDKIIHKNKLLWKPSAVEWHDFQYFWTILSSKGRFSSKKLNALLSSYQQGKYKSKELFFYHFITQQAVCLINRTKWSMEIYNDYIKRLKEFGFLTTLLNPVRAKELSCLVDGNKMKALHLPRATEQKADIYRALAAIKISSPLRNEPDFTSKTNTYRRRYKALEDEYSSPIQSVETILLDTDKGFCTLFLDQFKRCHEKQGEHKKIRSWDEILRLLQEFDEYLPQNFDVILKEIFIVCIERRDWKIPQELKLKKSFDKWTKLGFFTTLYYRLDKNAKVKEMDGVRWHMTAESKSLNKKRQQVPSQKDQREYTPFWGKYKGKFSGDSDKINT